MAYPTHTPRCCYYAEIAMFLSSFPSYAPPESSILPQWHMCPTELVRGNGNYSERLNYLFFCSAHTSTWSFHCWLIFSNEIQLVVHMQSPFNTVPILTIANQGHMLTGYKSNVKIKTELAEGEQPDILPFQKQNESFPLLIWFSSCTTFHLVTHSNLQDNLKHFGFGMKHDRKTEQPLLWDTCIPLKGK